MNKFKVLRIVNPLLILVFLIQAVTGIIFTFVSNIPYVQLLAAIHKYNGVLMVVLVIIHVSMNWGWIKANILKI
jgi:cytochrome b subunit of formate dehydrogenase